MDEPHGYLRRPRGSDIVNVGIVGKGVSPFMRAAVRHIEATRVGENGRISVPTTYRKLHKLSKGSEVLLVRLGDALMVVPSDIALDRICDRIQGALAGRNISPQKALDRLPQVRRRRFQRLYGKR